MKEDYMREIINALPRKLIDKDPAMLIAAPLMASVLVDHAKWPEMVAARAVILGLNPEALKNEAGDGVAEDFMWENLVPPAGLEPALPKEPHFECGASTNSAKGATLGLLIPDEVGLGNGPKETPWARSAVINGYGLPSHIAEALADIQLPTGWGLEARKLSVKFPAHAYTTDEYQVRIISGPTVDNMTGYKIDGWNGRWWRLSQHMTKGEVVQTVFKATLTAVEYEVRETFLYRGVSVLDPHYDIDQLVEFRKDPSSILGRS